jgi:3-oxoadipate enol-lactonase
MKKATSGDVQLHYEHTLRPGAPALLLINSLGTTLGMWDDQFAALSSRYELIRYDARGHGKSTTGAQAEVSLDRLADDALAVLDACGVARAHVCGLSLGGMTAMQVARQAPDRVLKLVLSNTSTYMPTRETWQSRIETVTTHGMEPIVEGTLERWFTPEFRAKSPDKVARIRSMLLATDPKGYAACCAAIRDMDLRDKISAITAKTMVIAGLRDPATPLPHAQHIHAAIAESKLVTFDAAHLSNIECAAEYTVALENFLLT